MPSNGRSGFGSDVYYPEFWEYCRMHDRNFMTPGWAHILQAIFPGERRTKEIDGLDQLLDIIYYNLG